MIDRRLLRETRSELHRLAGVVFAGLLVAVATVLQAHALSASVAAVFLQHRTFAEITPLLVLLAAVILARALLTTLADALAGEIAIRIKSKLRRQLLAHLTRLGPAALAEQESGELSTVLVEGIESLHAYFSQYLPQLVLAALVPVVVLVFVFPRDWLSGLVLLLTAPLIPVFMVLIGHAANALTRKRWALLSRLGAHFLDVLQGLTTLKTLGRSKDKAAEIAEMTDRFREATLAVLRVAFLSALVLELVATISTAVVAVEIGLRLLRGGIGFQESLFVLVLAPEFYLPLRLLGSRFHTSVEAVSAADRITRVLQLQPATRPAPAVPRSVPQPPFHVRFERVGFRYPASTAPALADVTFSLEPGQKVALVGKTGAGKSTLASLLMRFLDPTQGQISVNGADLCSLDPDAWRRYLAWVPQRPHLFYGTIEDNLRLARPDATEAELWKALEQAHLAQFVASLPQGLRTPVGESGARLSGGQAQRLALARAFLRQAPLLVLDEPTSNVDPELEAELQETTRELLRGRTALVIAHRLNTVADADQIVVLQSGKAVQVGTHQELLSQPGPYADLVNAFLEGKP
ncbi:MAG: thiol reductant ABC exporter subunit CydD [Calditrichaeota bacterium]|nr:thiol reductant ABC exporter subunit CydD [Calditrichota bacterium]